MKKTYSAFFLVLAFFSLVTFMLSNSKKVQADEIFNVKSKSCYVIDYDSNRVIYSKNENERLPIASMCKIMTLNIIFDEIEKGNFSLTDDIFVSETASGMGGSQIFLEGNTNYKAEELIKGIVVASANDACVAFAEKISGSEQNFVALMNKTASELNMNDTVFTNCTGLPKEGQFSTAKDVSKMFIKLLSYEDYYKFSNIWMDEIHHKENRITQISNTNKLVRFYEGCDGGKTGYTSTAGFCLASTAKRNDIRVVSVVIASPDSKTRFSETSNFFNYVFNNFEKKKVVDKEKVLDDKITVNKGKKDVCLVKPKDDFSILLKKGEKQSFDIEINFDEYINAPVMENDKVGTISVYKDGIEVKKIDIIASENIEKQTLADLIKNTAEKWTIFS